MNRKYELVYLVSPEASDEEVADLHAQVDGIVQRLGGPARKDRQLGPPEARLRNRPAQGSDLRAGVHQWLGRDAEGARPTSEGV